MSRSLILWDRHGDPQTPSDETIFWQSHAGDETNSVPRYLEKHAQRIKDRYLAFVFELGQHQISGKRIIDHLDPGDGISLWWMTHIAEKSPFKSPPIYDCLRLMALEEMLVSSSPTGLQLVSTNSKLAVSLRQLCEKSKIEFRWQPFESGQGKLTLRSLYDRLPYRVRGLLSLRYLITRLPLRRLVKDADFSAKQAVFFCSYFIHLDMKAGQTGKFYSRQWGKLPTCLQEAGRRTNWVQHFLISPEIPNIETGLRWMRCFNRSSQSEGRHAFVESFLSCAVIVRALRRWLWLNRVASRLHTIESAFTPRDSSISLWPLLEGEWLTSVRGAIAFSNCLWIELFDAALKQIPRQELGLYLYENQGWESALLRAWRKYGHGKIIGVQHATVPFWHLYYFEDTRVLSDKEKSAKPMPDKLAVNGPMARKAFSSSGYPVDGLVEVEALRYLELASSRAEDNERTRRSFLQKQLDAQSAALKVLIIGDILPNSTDALLKLFAAAMTELKQDYQTTIKAHPSNPIDPTNYPHLNLQVTTDALSKVLSQFDVAVAAYSTSASLDAYLSGIPVVVYLPGEDLNLNPLRGHPGVRFVATTAELTEALRVAMSSAWSNPKPEEFFCLDQQIPRWRNMLGLQALSTQ